MRRGRVADEAGHQRAVEAFRERREQAFDATPRSRQPREGDADEAAEYQMTIEGSTLTLEQNFEGLGGFGGSVTSITKDGLGALVLGANAVTTLNDLSSNLDGIVVAAGNGALGTDNANTTFPSNTTVGFEGDISYTDAIGRIAQEQGGELLTGGNVIDRSGYFVEPTVIRMPADAEILGVETAAEQRDLLAELEPRPRRVVRAVLPEPGEAREELGRRGGGAGRRDPRAGDGSPRTRALARADPQRPQGHGTGGRDHRRGR